MAYQHQAQEAEGPAGLTSTSGTHYARVLLHAASSALPRSGTHRCQCLTYGPPQTGLQRPRCGGLLKGKRPCKAGDHGVMMPLSCCPLCCLLSKHCTTPRPGSAS